MQAQRTALVSSSPIDDTPVVALSDIRPRSPKGLSADVTRFLG